LPSWLPLSTPYPGKRMAIHVLLLVCSDRWPLVLIPLSWLLGDTFGTFPGYDFDDQEKLQLFRTAEFVR
jgi:hypothetical protein